MQNYDNGSATWSTDCQLTLACVKANANVCISWCDFTVLLHLLFLLRGFLLHLLDFMDMSHSLLRNVLTNM